MSLKDRSYLTVDLDLIEENVKSLKRYIDGVKLMAVVKANAYGLGIEEVSKALDGSVDWFGVATINEAMQIRKRSKQSDILVLGYVPLEQTVLAVDNDITLSTVSLAYIEERARLVPNGKKLKVHIKLDTGLNRIGLSSQTHDVFEYVEQAEKILKLPNVEVTGIYTHFAVSDSKKPEDVNFTRKQYEIFDEVVGELERRKFKLGLKHVCNSNAIINYPEYHLDMVRTGKFLFGFGQNEDIDEIPINLSFKLKARIVEVKCIKRGESVGYGRTFIAKEDMKIAVISFGFGDGYRREMKGLQVLINGHRSNVLGRIAMDYMIADVTEIQDISPGDYATLVGENLEEVIMPNEISKLISGSTPEILSQLGNRTRRVYHGGE